jgi:hypothetical protein
MFCASTFNDVVHQQTRSSMILPAAPARRWAIRAGTAAFTATVLAAGLQFSSAALAASHPAPATANPYSPAYGHPYRHGVVPTRGQASKMSAWTRQHPTAIPGAASSDLRYGGGIDGIGVTTGTEKVYLVFYGSQWGTVSTNANGNTTLSGDPAGEAPYLQQLMKGLGTGGELWSGVMTQYCDGVAVGSTSCPGSNQSHVAYPTGGPLAGVWVDESAASPAQATGHQLALEAINAAAHFGNTTAASNRDAQYVIISPTGTDPDQWLQQGFCAWHDYNGDSTLSGGAATSPYGDIAFTNFPYVHDLGTSCGQSFVNAGSAGNLDGVSIVEGHEYAETITDQNPAGGWTNSSGSETGDLCAWNQGPGAHAANLALPTGAFAMQPTWANDGGGTCEFSHAIVTNGSGGGTNTVTVTNPGSQSSTRNVATSLQIVATDSGSGQTLTYAASNLPRGLTINSSTGRISGTPTRLQTRTVTVTVTDTTGAQGSTSFSWTIHS